MIFRYMSFENINAVGKAYFTDQFPCPGGTFSAQYWFSILGDPDDVIFEIKDRMSPFTI